MLPSIASAWPPELAVRESGGRHCSIAGRRATVPFIARYRKEATGGLDDTQLRQLDERLRYLRELDDRRATILASIGEQDKLSAELEAALYAATDKTTLEDLYLPYKPKRRTKAQIARETGTEPLADSLLTDPTQDPQHVALAYVNAEAGVADAKGGAGRRTRHPDRTHGRARRAAGRVARKTLAIGRNALDRGGRQGRSRRQSLPIILPTPSRFGRFLAPRAGAAARPQRRRAECAAELAAKADAPTTQRSDYELMIAEAFDIADRGRPADKWLLDGVRLAWRAKIVLSLELELTQRLRGGRGEAIQVFARNLRPLLAAPAGPRPPWVWTPACAPASRWRWWMPPASWWTPAPSTRTRRNDWDKSIAVLAALCARHRVELIAIGNGTASRKPTNWPPT